MAPSEIYEETRYRSKLGEQVVGVMSSPAGTARFRCRLGRQLECFLLLDCPAARRGLVAGVPASKQEAGLCLKSAEAIQTAAAFLDRAFLQAAQILELAD